MESLRVLEPRELTNALEDYSRGFLFRGQTAHHTTSSGEPSLTSSLVRNGCIPPRMFQWSFWAREILSRAGVPLSDPAAAQSLLQHYGWRSLFLDLTAAPGVAAWFASWSYKGTRAIERLCEPFEKVRLLRKIGQYLPSDSEGHVYVLSKHALEKAYRLYDLTGLQFGDRCRPEVQQAWLCGVLNRYRPSLDPACISAHISGPACVFREVATSHGYTSVPTVFPASSEDAVLRQLEAQAWIRRRGVPGVRVYARSIDFPDYHDEKHTLLPPAVALYSTRWLAGRRQGDFSGALFFKSPDSMFYISDPRPNVFGEKFWSLLYQYRMMVVEARTILRIPRADPRPEYFKGVVAECDGDGALWVSELFVDYVGEKLVGWGSHLGYRYERRGGAAVRSPAASECPCGDVRWHTYHLSVLYVLSDSLDRAQVKKTADLTYRVKEW